MITVTLTLPIKPGKMDQFMNLIRTMIPDTARQPGFRSVKVHPHSSGEGKAVFIEEWDSEAAYQDYLAWRAGPGADTTGIFADCLAGAPEMDFWGEAVVTA